MEAIVLAGGSPEDPLARRFGVASKALLPYRGRPLVEQTLQALHRAGLEVVLVGPPAPLCPSPKAHLADQGGLLANLEAGLQAAQGERVLVSTGDMPFLSAEAVRWVLQNAPEAGFVYTIVARSTIEARFPGMRRTYARVREGVFTGGNIALLDKSLFRRALPLIQRALALRKRPLALARMVGLGTLVRVLLGQAGIPELERRVSQILGLPARALPTPYAEVGVDLDREEDLRWLGVD
ncbi:MAG: nucleotidyltransferase family protein [Meiothermus sp.]|uniref:NTP transferase domain-containing protein n=1 Tax=Meiothermus sp. TaxID=1955249 RepID=UPI0025FDFF66|nr:NTP transferase domain-containing protein [Meiothermus sp.]MCS7058383.1 nucleotidyltransferase family protein [Meiothermus sp.]MCS7194389.1 nucleotidyltransferase family protein [Meiothermus sp.]MCX7740589.1 nucleotidyltransferase family protein [Meiothermus sp.]MDW8089870.1 NTP transferase domain-containing protein [Meiothermus sp.]MDW8481704.1 NTP transferase domain-containing protein [Meiothermus sp.]